MKKTITMLIMIGIFSVHFLHAQTTASQPDTGTLNFIKTASIAGMTEVKAGKLATNKSNSSNVKSFANRMVADHSKANDQLMQLIKSKNWDITPPSDAETNPDKMLTGASGAAFDKAYVTMMVQDHQKAVALFENAANTVQDADIKAFAKQTLPTLQQHLASIQSIATKMNISAAPLKP